MDHNVSSLLETPTLRSVQNLVEYEDVNSTLIGPLQTISRDLRPYARNILELDKVVVQIALSDRRCGAICVTLPDLSQNTISDPSSCVR